MSAATNVTPQTPFRVLYLEDDPTHRELTREFLQRRGPCVVDFATTTEEATLRVEATTYDAVLVDVRLDLTEGTDTQGDDWLFAKVGGLGNAFVAIVTAQKPRLRHAKWLHDKGIPIVEKGHDELELYARLTRRLAPSAGYSTGQAPAMHDPADEEWTANMLTQKTLSLFSEWVESLPDADTRDVWMHGQWLSPRDLQREMSQADSSVGREIASLFLDHVRAALGLDVGEGK